MFLWISHLISVLEDGCNGDTLRVDKNTEECGWDGGGDCQHNPVDGYQIAFCFIQPVSLMESAVLEHEGLRRGCDGEGCIS